MKKSLVVLLAVVMAAVLAFSACSKEAKNNEETSTQAAAVSSITADDAKTIALEKAGVPETAAENLDISETEYEGEAAYLVKFSWSGFDYEFTINAASGKIVHRLFNGDELAVD